MRDFSSKNLWLFSPLVGLILLAGVLGYRLGRPVSETAIINSYADRYVAEYGGSRTDCLARPGGTAAVRLSVECRSPSGGLVIYAVCARGGLISVNVGKVPEA